MYLTENFYEFVVPSYIGSKTQSSAVQLLSAHELRNAAREELLKSSSKINVEDVYSSAASALEALNTIMARKMRLQGGGYGDREPSLLEATLYAYLYLLLEMPIEKWKDARLPKMIRKYPELMRMERDIRTVYDFEAPTIYGQNE
jgi:metaxin